MRHTSNHESIIEALKIVLGHRHMEAAERIKDVCYQLRNKAGEMVPDTMLNRLRCEPVITFLAISHKTETTIKHTGESKDAINLFSEDRVYEGLTALGVDKAVVNRKKNEKPTFSTDHHTYYDGVEGETSYQTYTYTVPVKAFSAAKVEAVIEQEKRASKVKTDAVRAWQEEEGGKTLEPYAQKLRAVSMNRKSRSPGTPMLPFLRFEGVDPDLAREIEADKENHPLLIKLRELVGGDLQFAITRKEGECRLDSALYPQDYGAGLESIRQSLAIILKADHLRRAAYKRGRENLLTQSGVTPLTPNFGRT